MKRKELKILFKTKESGNGALELILFIPVALFFLFIIVDVGLYIGDRAKVDDLVRSMLHDVNTYSEALNLLDLNSDFSLEVNEKNAKDFVKKLSSDFYNKVLEERKGEGFSLEVSLFKLSFNPSTGSLLYKKEIYSSGRKGGFSLRTKVPEYPYITKEEYIKKIIKNSKEQTPFSKKTSIRYNIKKGSYSSENKFSPLTLIIYIELETESHSISGSTIRTLLGHYLGTQSQGVETIRTKQI